MDRVKDKSYTVCKKRISFIINNAYVGSAKSTARRPLETNGKPHERQKQKLFELTTTRHLIKKTESLWHRNINRT